MSDYKLHRDSADLRFPNRFCLNLGWLYTRLVAFNSWENNTGPSIGLVEDGRTQSDPSEATSLLTRSTNAHLNESIVEFMAMYAFGFCARSW